MNTRASIICPLCNDAVDKVLYQYHIDGEKKVIRQIKEQNPGWTENDGACGRCVDYYHTEVIIQKRVIPGIGPYFPVKSVDDFVILPTGLRLDADQRFSGKGVTICFIDSGFYPHPDLMTHQSRIRKIVDIPLGKDITDTIPGEEAWHGTMTTVVCAGDGYLSNGLYKGIATGAELVLLKVQDPSGAITSENIVKALQWVLDHHNEHSIRIVNMSIGDNKTLSYHLSEVDQLAEQLIAEGITVVAAIGNDENGMIQPPANSPHVISVGGVDDRNELDRGAPGLYHSSFGTTEDQLVKPELVAHAIWIAAPILPGTKAQRESATLHQLLQGSNEQLLEELHHCISSTGLDLSLLQSNDGEYIRQAIIDRIGSCKFISPHYMHVDGTSFAAPIVSAIIAQLLEVNPELDPISIRDILFSTAKRIEDLPAERQGFGIIQPRPALLKALQKETFMIPVKSPRLNTRQRTIEFHLRHTCATQVSLAGSFNHWEQDVLLLEPRKAGLWTIEIPMLPPGKYSYKFFIDKRTWQEDINNPYREPDGFNGFNSILFIDN